MNNDNKVYTLKEAITEAIKLADEYKQYRKVFAVVKYETGYAIIGGKYAMSYCNRQTIEFITEKAPL